jgi:hypothetical protein
MPSFRLRQAPAKPAAATPAPAKAPAEASVASTAQDVPQSGDSAGGGRPGEGAARARPEPAAAALAKARERVPSEPGGYWHPPLPPQERFQDWGKVRAPVREAGRPPSLFERVTASFARSRERIDDAPVSPPGRPESAEPRLATVEEDAYDIPAFLRR